MNFDKQPTVPLRAIKRAVASSDSALPKTIGPYPIFSLLKRGGMSQLYLGVDPATEKPVVIKTLRQELLGSSAMQGLLLKEAELLKKQRHPNIVAVIGTGQSELGTYFATELVTGLTLTQFIMQESFQLKKIAAILLEIAAALSHLHELGIIHCDLKPENIMLTEEGAVKLLDFGIAKLTQEKGDEKAVHFGSPTYMSPQLLENPSTPDVSDDLYALGIIGYELLTAAPLKGRPDLTKLPPAIRKIIAQITSLYPATRKSAADLVMSLSSYITSSQLESDLSSFAYNKLQQQLFFIAEQSLNLLPEALQFDTLKLEHAKRVYFDAPYLYSSFFRVNQSEKLLVVAAAKQGVEGIIFCAKLSGKIKLLIEQNGQQNLDLLIFTKSLQEQLRSATVFSFLLLKEQSFSFLSYGNASLHLFKGEQWRDLSSNSSSAVETGYYHAGNKLLFAVPATSSPTDHLHILLDSTLVSKTEPACAIAITLS